MPNVVGGKIDNCDLKCSFCLGMWHIEDRCWKKNGKGPFTFVNFLEVLINDEEATLIKLKQLFKTKHNFFSRAKMPKCKMHVQASHLKHPRKRIENLDTLG